MTLNTDPVALFAIILLSFVTGCMFSAWREQQRRELRRWLRRQRRI